MKNLNTFNRGNELVAILRNAADGAVLISSRGDIAKLAAKVAETVVLDRTTIVDGGTYNEKFVQAAIGGLTELPKKHASGEIYTGKDASVFVTATDKEGMVKVAIGIPAEAYIHPEAEGYKDTKRNKGTQAALPDFAGPKSEQDFNKASEDDLIPLTGGNDEGEESFENVPKLTLEFKNLKNVSVEQIQDFFEEHQDDFLSVPTVIKIDNGKETLIKRQKGSATIRTTKKASDYYGLSPMMERICKKCQGLNIVDVNRKTGSATVICHSCGYKYVYEGSVGTSTGLAGQDKL